MGNLADCRILEQRFEPRNRVPEAEILYRPQPAVGEGHVSRSSRLRRKRQTDELRIDAELTVGNDPKGEPARTLELCHELRQRLGRIDECVVLCGSCCGWRVFGDERSKAEL